MYVTNLQQSFTVVMYISTIDKILHCFNHCHCIGHCYNLQYYTKFAIITGTTPCWYDNYINRYDKYMISMIRSLAVKKFCQLIPCSNYYGCQFKDQSHAKL